MCPGEALEKQEELHGGGREFLSLASLVRGNYINAHIDDLSSPWRAGGAVEQVVSGGVQIGAGRGGRCHGDVEHVPSAE